MEPLRLTFRRHVREQALRATREMTVEKGWSRVRLSEVASAIGVSRPTLYKEFGDKRGLGEALILQETERVLIGISQVLDDHAGDAVRGVAAAVEFTLREAEVSPLLRALLTAARDGDNDALPLVTTRSQPVLDAATRMLTTWFTEHFANLKAADVEDAAEALARLTVSHLVLPTDDRTSTARRLARIAMRCLRLDDPVATASTATSDGAGDK